MIKYLVPLLLISIGLQSCLRSGADLKRDGGIRIRLEASAADLIKDNIRPGDTLAFAMLKNSGTEQSSFIDKYFDQLQKADPVRPAGAHFMANGLAPAASATECRAFFTRYYLMGTEMTVAILNKRLDKYGISGQTVTKAKELGGIIIELPGKDVDLFRVRRLVMTSAKLEFYETYDNSQVYSLLESLNRQLAKEDSIRDAATPEAQRKAITGNLQKDLKEQEIEKRQRLEKANPLFVVLSPAIGANGNNGSYTLLPGPVVGYANEKDTARVNRLLSLMPTAHLSGGPVKFMWLYKSSSSDIYPLVALRTGSDGKAALTGNIVNDAGVLEDDNHMPQLTLTMKPDAAKKWKRLTADNIGNSIAIVLDDYVYSYPTVQSEISGGVSSITGNFTKQEAADLASVLNAGYLPLRVMITQEEAIAPEKE